MTVISRTLRLTILLAALLLTGCATLPPPPIAPAAGDSGTSAAPDPSALLGVEWQLVEIHQTGGQVLVVDNPTAYTIAFGTDGSFGGQLQCNRMSGSYRLDGGKLVFGPIASTMAFCPDDGIFAIYNQALSSANSYEVVDGRLVVGFGTAGGELVYAAADPAVTAASAPTLTDTLWQLQTIRLADGTLLQPAAGEVETVRFAADGTVEGQADCNTFGGSYTLGNGLISFGPLRSTRAACPPASLSDRFLQALAEAKAYGYDGEGNLSIAFGPEANALEFVAAAPTQAEATAVDLANATYSGIYTDSVTLTDGAYAGEPFVAGGASRPTVTLQPDTTASGDLNGDGVADGVAVLAENSGGSGSFVYLAALLAQKDAQATGVTLLLGDRVRVESVAIVDGQIEVVAATFADSDPMCCPSLRSRFVFGLMEGALVELSAEKL